jgi:hypothetical protein
MKERLVPFCVGLVMFLAGGYYFFRSGANLKHMIIFVDLQGKKVHMSIPPPPSPTRRKLLYISGDAMQNPFLLFWPHTRTSFQWIFDYLELWTEDIFIQSGHSSFGQRILDSFWNCDQKGYYWRHLCRCGHWPWSRAVTF